MDFKSVTVVKAPVETVWGAMRDDLPEIAALLDDIESVTFVEREPVEPGVVRIVNIWQAAPNLPAAVARHVSPEMLAWTDTATWMNETRTCAWTIEPHYARDYMHCSGATRFEPAIGGRGTRITFRGEIGWAREGEGPKGLEGLFNRGIETVLPRVIPSVFQKLTKAVARHLEEQARA